jgi:uncharacterized protein YaiI (UPF0178 family)
MTDKNVTKIWIDGDACPRPVKDIVYRASERLRVPVKVVANSPMFVPHNGLVELIVVSSGFDVADAHIVSQVGIMDLVITADIPLASEVVKSGSTAINPKGELYTAESIGERLAVRNLMAEIRSSGEIVGGSRPYSDQDKKAFAAAFDRTLTKILRASQRSTRAQSAPAE